MPVRLDADKSYFAPYLVPQPGREYVDASDYTFATETNNPGLLSTAKDLYSDETLDTKAVLTRILAELKPTQAI